MKASLKVGRIFGVPINIHITFLIILPLFAYAFAVSDLVVFGIPLGFGGLNIDILEQLVLGTIAAIIFFISVLVHELAHSYIAIRNGYTISGITLFIFGGVSQIEKVPPRAPGEALMAFVGPATSFAIGLISMPIGYGFKALGSSLPLEILMIVFGLTGFYNILLGGFNMLPAFPMDGGRILRSVLAKRMGFIRATETAVSIGKALAVAMAIIGIFINIWLILIALFIYIGAGEEEKSAKVSYTLEGVKVRDIMTTEISAIEPDIPMRRLLDRMLEEKHLGYPVMEEGRLLGVVTLHDLTKVMPSHHDMVMVRDVMSKDIISVSPDSDAMDAVQLISRKNIGRLMVMQNGELVGILTRTDLMKALEIYSAKVMLSEGSSPY